MIAARKRREGRHRAGTARIHYSSADAGHCRYTDYRSPETGGQPALRARVRVLIPAILTTPDRL
jgi:hypothetical protein